MRSARVEAATVRGPPENDAAAGELVNMRLSSTKTRWCASTARRCSLSDRYRRSESAASLLTDREVPFARFHQGRVIEASSAASHSACWATQSSSGQQHRVSSPMPGLFAPSLQPSAHVRFRNLKIRLILPLVTASVGYLIASKGNGGPASAFTCPSVAFDYFSFSVSSHHVAHPVLRSPPREFAGARRTLALLQLSRSAASARHGYPSRLATLPS